MCCLSCFRLLGELFLAMRADHQVITLPSFCSWWYCSWPRDGGQHHCLPPQCYDGQQISILNQIYHLKPAELKYTYIFLYFLGDEGLHTVDWNNPQVGCPHSAEKGRAAEKKGQWGPGTKTGAEWGAQTRRVGDWFNTACLCWIATSFIWLFYNNWLWYWKQVIYSCIRN